MNTPMKKSGERAVFCTVTLVFYLAHAATAFVAAYLKQIGYTASGAGAVMALLNCVGIAASPVLGNFADRIGSSRRAFITAIVCAGVLMALCQVCGTTALFGIPLLSLVLAAWAFFRIPANSLLDAWTLRRAQKSGAFSFGSIRLVGSIAGATMCIVYGALIEKTGTAQTALLGYSVFAFLAAILCATIGRRADDGGENRGASAKKSVGVRAALSCRPFVWFLICHAAMGIPIYDLTTFLPYRLSEMGVSAGILGVLVAVKSYTEVPMLFFGAKCLEKWDAKKLLSLCFFAFLLEHLACAFAPNVIVVAVALMAHGLFFGLYLACMTHYVCRITPPEAVASAQSLLGSAALIVAVLGNLVGGPLVDALGASAFFCLGAGLFALALGIFAVSSRKAV